MPYGTERLEQRVTTLEELPARLDALTLQISQLRGEMHAEFSATHAEMRALHTFTARSIDELRAHTMTLHEDVLERIRLTNQYTQTQMRALNEDTQTRMRAVNEDTQTQMRILHEDVIARLTMLHEGRPRRKRR